MNADRAQALAEALHHGQLDPAGTPLIDHIRRVAAAVPDDARVVAWLHQALEHTSISEQELLSKGLSRDELRALRLLTRDTTTQSTTRYLAHVETIAGASGPAATPPGASNAPTSPIGRSTLRSEATVVAPVRARARDPAAAAHRPSQHRPFQASETPALRTP